jgi:hypothetical protein
MKYVKGLEHMRLSQPADFWKLIKPPTTSIKVDPDALYRHYVKLLASVPVGYQPE